MKIRILFCGGHISPAIAVIEKLNKRDNCLLYYVGRKHPLENDPMLSLEYLTLRKTAGVSFFDLNTGRLQRSFSVTALRSLLKIPGGFMESMRILRKVNPHIVVAFGGYIAFSVCLAAKITGIPFILHEQTRILGLANRLLAIMSRVLCLSWHDTEGIPAGIKVEYTGLPIREDILRPEKTGITDFGDANKPLIYITGGSLGSRFINSVILPLVPKLVSRYRILHQCGNAENGRDWNIGSDIKSKLKSGFKKNYRIIPNLRMHETGEVYKDAALVIGRSGANTVYELAYKKKRAILIPLPWSGQGEQEKNARFLEESGLGKILHQDEITPDKLLREIDIQMNNRINLSDNQQMDTPVNGTQKFIDCMSSVVYSIYGEKL